MIVRDLEGFHQRRLEAPTCEELEHAAALIVALAIDPALLANQSIPSGTSSFALQTQPTVEPNSMQSPNAAPRSFPIAERAESSARFAVPLRDPATERLYWRLGLSAFAGYQTLPGINLGTGLFGAIQTRGLRLELAASSLSAQANPANAPRRGATFALYRIAPRVCWFVTEKAWSAGPCAGIELGRLTGRGYGVTNALLLELRIASSSVVGIFAEGRPHWASRFHLRSRINDEPVRSTMQLNYCPPLSLKVTPGGVATDPNPRQA